MWRPCAGVRAKYYEPVEVEPVIWCGLKRASLKYLGNCTVCGDNQELYYKERHTTLTRLLPIEKTLVRFLAEQGSWSLMNSWRTAFCTFWNGKCQLKSKALRACAFPAQLMKPVEKNFRCMFIVLSSFLQRQEIICDFGETVIKTIYREDPKELW